MAHQGRFASLDAAQISALIASKDSKSTQNCIKSATKLFREYLISIDCQADFENYAKDELDKNLSFFYANVRTNAGQMYKKKALDSIKYGISRYLKDKDVDINTDAAFIGSRETLKAVTKELKRQGFGSVEHKAVLTKDDMLKLYDPSHLTFDVNTPAGLQQKVWFELMY